MRKEVRIVRRLARGRVFKKEGNGRRIEVFYLHDEKERQALNSSAIVSESEGGNVNLATDQNENNDTTKRRKENKEELGSGSTPSIGARILRALSKTREDKISNSKGKDDVNIFARNRRELDVFEIEKDDEEAAAGGGVNDEFVSVNKEGNNNNNNGDRELKRKRRRRPRLMDLRAQDEALGMKIDDDDHDDIYGGRPMVWLGEGSQLYVDMHGANYIHIHIHNTKERVKQEEDEIVLAAEIRTKQFARRLIMKQLLAAGWKVDHRIPATNIGSDHQHHHDVVYVSPEGKTHSSIALAYSRLKRHYEAGDGERKVYRPRFKLAPVPQMLVNVLTHQEVGGSSAANPDFTSPYKMPGQMRDDKKRRKRYKRKCVPYYGKRTVLSWMIDMGTIRENEPVYYMDTSVLLEGMIARGGIHCGCCNEIVSISEFEAHSRHTTKTNLSNPLRNICTERGASLLQCMLESWYKLDISKRQSFRFININRGQDSHDDTCLVCGELGDVVCCDSCPSVFHRSCLDMQEVPSGEWHCTYCCCKFCGLLGRNTNQIGSSTNHSIEPSLFTCRYCERKYHKSCLEANCSKIIVHSRDAIFCGNRCQEICERLESILGIKHYIEEGLSWSFIYGTDVDWHMKPHMVECNSKLAVALSLMDECFRQHIDHRTGINVIHNVLYNIGSNFERLNFERFFTAILEKGDDIICVASIRIHPNRLAEMPYIGTRYTYRRQGMCRRFLKAIEWALRYLNVDLLVIPAIAELRNTWITAFGFEPLALETKQIIKNMNLMKFSGVEVLQKKISDHNFSYENLIPAQVSNDLQKNRGVDMEANVNCDGAENIIYLSD